MFTPIMITGTFERADQAPAQGTVTLTLSARIQNGLIIIDTEPIVARLGAAGQLINSYGGPLVVVANDDPGTLPAGTSYAFLIETDAAPAHRFSAVVPHAAAGASIDITALQPAAP